MGWGTCSGEFGAGLVLPVGLPVIVMPAGVDLMDCIFSVVECGADVSARILAVCVRSHM